MKRLFLASSIDRTAKSISEDIGKDNLELAFIKTADEAEKPPFDWLEKDRQGLINAGFKLFDYTITDKNTKEIENDLKAADVIHVNGGNTPYLLLQSRKSEFDKWIVKAVGNGKIYIGSSAGSIIAGPKIPEYLFEKKFKKLLKDNVGFGFVNFSLMCHWGQKYFRDMYLKKRVKMSYKSTQIPFIILTDTQYIKVEDDMCKIIDIRNK